MIDVKTDPTTKDIRWFAALLLLFSAAIGYVALKKGEAMLIVAIVLGVAWLASMLFNAVPRRTQCLGLILPLICLAIGGPIRAGASPMTIATILWVLGALVSIGIFALPTAGKWVFVGWMLAAVPIGWTISYAIMAIAFYLVVTPIGLVMRLCRYDPMKRRLDAAAPSYWTPHSTEAERSRYLRQF